MKPMILSALLALAPLTSAAAQVEYDLSANFSQCELGPKFEIIECKTSGDAKRTKVKKEMEAYDCKPACRYNESAAYEESFRFKPEGDYPELSFDVWVSAGRTDDVLDKTKVDYNVEIQVQPTGGHRSEARGALSTVSDLASFGNLYLNGRPYYHALPNGHWMELQPYVIVRNVKITD